MNVAVLTTKGFEFIDITAPDHVAVSVDSDHHRLWVNVDGRCVLRICHILKGVDIEDQAQDLPLQLENAEVVQPSRDFKAKPYSADEHRVATWLCEKGVGGGDDPIGFLMSSVFYCSNELSKYRKRFGELPDEDTD